MRYKNAKVNVLFVIMQMSMGGSERLVCNLTAKLDRKKFRPSVLWFNGEKPLKEFVDLNVPLYHVHKGRGFDFGAMRRIAGIIRDNNIHVVNAHHFMPMVYSFYGSCLRNNARLFNTAHSEWELEELTYKWRVMGRCLFNRAEGLIGVTEKVSDTAIRRLKIFKDKVYTIENGVDLDDLKEQKDSMAIRKELRFGDKEVLIGIVANLTRIKNHIFLLKGFKELVATRPDVRLLIIGKGVGGESGDLENMEPKIRDFIRQNGLDDSVRLLGYRPDVRDILGALDIFCLTSFKEGLPISLLEAMAMGLPVVGTDVEGIRDVIDDKRTGYLVKKGDVDGLKDTLVKLVDDGELRKNVGKLARAVAIKKFSLRECVKKHENLFLRAAESH